MMYGFVIGVSVLGSITGAPIAGWVFDTWGTYDGIWFALAGLSVAAIVIVLTIPPVRNKIQLADKPRVREDTL